MKEKLNYEKAFAELSKIVEEMEGGSIKLDQLKTRIDRANELISFCREQLRSTEDDVNKAIEKSASQ